MNFPEGTHINITLDKDGMTATYKAMQGQKVLAKVVYPAAPEDPIRYIWQDLEILFEAGQEITSDAPDKE